PSPCRRRRQPGGACGGNALAPTWPIRSITSRQEPPATLALSFVGTAVASGQKSKRSESLALFVDPATSIAGDPGGHFDRTSTHGTDSRIPLIRRSCPVRCPSKVGFGSVVAASAGYRRDAAFHLVADWNRRRAGARTETSFVQEGTRLVGDHGYE